MKKYIGLLVTLVAFSTDSINARLRIGNTTSQYCDKQTIQLQNNVINPQSNDPVDKAILTYQPVVYLYDSRFFGSEEYLPITMESYINNASTKVLYQTNHRTKNAETPQTIIPQGHVSMEKLADKNLYKGLEKISNNLYIQSANCIDFGENPDTTYTTPYGANFKAQSGKIINTPYYAIYSQQGGHDYIQYIFVYGYNGDYDVLPNIPAVNLVNIGLGTHKMDVEHLVLQFEKDSIKNGNPKLVRIGFPAHGSGESKWHEAEHKDLQFEGTHIISYAAYHGHGMYPRAGVYVRICGFGNDHTTQGFKWFPKAVIRLERSDSNNFVPKTMGWASFEGDLGPEGVGGLGSKNWFGQPENEESGQDPNDKYCEEGTFGNKTCTTWHATAGCKPAAPETLMANYPSGTVFSPAKLAPSEVRVVVGSRLDFLKTNLRDVAPQFTNKANSSLRKVEVASLNIGVEGDAQVTANENLIAIRFNRLGKVYLTFTDSKNNKVVGRTTVSVVNKMK